MIRARGTKKTSNRKEAAVLSPAGLSAGAGGRSPGEAALVRRWQVAQEARAPEASGGRSLWFCSSRAEVPLWGWPTSSHLGSTWIISDRKEAGMVRVCVHRLSSADVLAPKTENDRRSAGVQARGAPGQQGGPSPLPCSGRPSPSSRQDAVAGL